MFKRGQITLFVIIAVLVIGAVSVFVLFQTNVIKAPVSSEQAQKIVSAEVQPVSDLVSKCIKESYSESVVKIGKQGGYCSPVPVKNIQLGNYSVPYLVEKSGNNYINNLLLLEGNGATVTEEIDRCVDMEKLTRCINGFKSFRDVNVNPTGELKWNAKFVGNNIILNINYPLTVSRADAKTDISEMKAEVKSGLYMAYNAATEITNSEASSQDFDMDKFSRDNLDVRIDRQGTAEGIYYYLTTVPQESEPVYEFNFAVER